MDLGAAPYSRLYKGKLICIGLQKLTLALLALPLLALLLLRTRGCWLAALSQWLLVATVSGAADVVVVLGGGGPERLHDGIAALKSGIGRELWFTGDAAIPVIRGWRYGQFAREIAVAEGVPAASLRLLASTSTWEDAQQIALLAKAQDVRSILVITDWYHARRAMMVLQRHLRGTGVRVNYQATRGLSSAPANWWRTERGVVAVSNELIRLAYYWRRYGLAPWSPTTGVIAEQ